LRWIFVTPTEFNERPCCFAKNIDQIIGVDRIRKCLELKRVNDHLSFINQVQPDC
jgi:hypothetical protein